MILDRYKIISSIGSGAFGKVYKCFDTKYQRMIALKTGDSRNPRAQIRMQQEYEMYLKLQGCAGIPKLYTIHKSKSIWYLSMECMGINLMKLWKLCNQKFSEKTVLMVALQMLFRLETIHERGVLHRDIKPDNFVIGRSTSSQSMYLLDFGLSIDKNSNGNQVFAGSFRYASRNNHDGNPYTSKDDLESMLYIILYFMKGSLPWQETINVVGSNDLRKLQREIGKCKKEISVQQLCEGCRVWCYNLANHILHPQTTPNYKLYKEIMKKRLVEMDEKFDYAYDWTSLPKRVFLR